MPLRKISIRVPSDEKAEAPRLDQFLAERLSAPLNRPVSRGLARKLVVAGAVYLNGSRVRIASKILRAGARIDVWIDEGKLDAAPVRGVRAEMTEAWILFEDEFVLAVDKPAGLPTQPTLDQARDHLAGAIKRFLSARDGSVDPYLGMHHRLDRDTSGVIVFAKTREANPGLARAFAERLVKKTYQALAQPSKHATGHPAGWPEAWVIENYLAAKKSARGKQSRMEAVCSGGDYACTRFRSLGRYPGGSWIEARPETGRMHQVRVHLADSGQPILGDSLYGGEEKWRSAASAERVMLHAAALTFPHPVHKTEMTVSSPPPEDFQKCLSTLSSGD